MYSVGTSLILANYIHASYSAVMGEIASHIEAFDDIYFVHTGVTDLDICTASSYRERLVQAIEDPVSKTIIVDLEGTKFIDSTGLAVLVGAFRKCRNNNKVYYVDATSDNTGRLQKIFAITGLDTVLQVITPREED